MQKYETIKEINRDRHQQYLNVQREAEELFVRNHEEYDNDITIYGTVGVLVRIADKIKRLSSITKVGVHLEDDEIIRDTLMDLQNLSTYGTILLDEDETMRDHYTGKMRDMLIKSTEKPNRTLTQSFMDTVDDLKDKIDKTVNLSRLYRSKSTTNLLNLVKGERCQVQDAANTNQIMSTQSVTEGYEATRAKEYDGEGREIEVKYDEDNNIIHDLFPYSGSVTANHKAERQMAEI